MICICPMALLRDSGPSLLPLSTCITADGINAEGLDGIYELQHTLDLTIGTTVGLLAPRIRSDPAKTPQCIARCNAKTTDVFREYSFPAGRTDS
jgi:hypothetical protein